MSIFTSRVTKTLPIPGEVPEQTVTIRKLAGRHLEAAAVEAQRKSMANVQAIGGPALVKEFMAMSDGPKPKPGTSEDDEDGPKASDAPVVDDPMNGYDPATLIKCGVIGWSLPDEVTPELLADMDDERVEWLSTEILKLAKPRLFQTVGQAEDARGNDSRPSTSL